MIRTSGDTRATFLPAFSAKITGRPVLEFRTARNSPTQLAQQIIVFGLTENGLILLGRPR